MRKILTFGGWYVLTAGLLMAMHETCAISLLGISEAPESGVPRQNSTNVDKPNNDSTPKSQEMTAGEAQGEEQAGRKLDEPYYFGWGALNASQLIRPPSNRSVVRKVFTIAEKKNSSRDANSAYKVMMVHRRFSNRKGHPPNHRSSMQPQDEVSAATYATVENVDEQLPIYASEYVVPPNQEYDENYNNNVIPLEDQAHSGYDTAMSDPYRANYVPQEVPYYGPYLGPPNPYAEEQAVLSGGAECSCPSVTRQMNGNCESPGSTFLNLMGSLGQNLWGLIQLIAVSSVPFLIPILAIKLVLVPLKILKFLKLIKLFVKFFILVPFFVRVVYPALSESFNLHDLLFQKPGHQHPHQQQQQQGEHNIHGHNNEEDSRRENLNSSLLFESEGGWDLSRCPSRVACEFATYLAASTSSHFPQNLVDFLARKAERTQRKETRRDDDDDDDDDGERDQLHRSEPFKAFVVALGKKWTQDMCETEYHCPLPFTSTNSFFF